MKDEIYRVALEKVNESSMLRGIKWQADACASSLYLCHLLLVLIDRVATRINDGSLACNWSFLAVDGEHHDDKDATSFGSALLRPMERERRDRCAWLRLVQWCQSIRSSLVGGPTRICSGLQLRFRAKVEGDRSWGKRLEAPVPEVCLKA